jgi:hypothetical protein
MSTSRHPIALRLERLVGSDAKLLATVMGLPLIDGIFPALVLAGALSGPVGILEVGLLVFGGSATLAVILAEMEGTPAEQVRVVLIVGAVLTAGAAVEAALAPTIQSVLDLATFERFAAIVIAAIAAKTASARIGEYLPRPAVIVGLGLLASLDPSGASLEFVADPVLVGKAAAAALVGTAFSLAVAATGPRLRRNVHVDRFRFGSAVALGLLALSILGLGFGIAPLAVVGVTALFALDPGRDGPVGDEDTGGDGPPAEGATATAAATDGGVADDPKAPETDGDADGIGDGADETPPAGKTVVPSESGSDDRAPWL